MKTPSTIGLRAALWAGPLFLASLLVFGALTPGFSHSHKAVSRLGAWDNPLGPWFGLFGLFIPGLFVTGAAVDLRRRLRELGVSTHWATGLVIYGLLMALTAVPADFSRMSQSPWTWAHGFFVLANPVVLFAVIPGCAKALKHLGASSAAANIFILLAALIVVEFALYRVFPQAPGLVQRLMILTAHGVIGWMSWTILRLPLPQRTEPDMRASIPGR